jgi:two-component system nitrate/nitrite response regulator NarL
MDTDAAVRCCSDAAPERQLRVLVISSVRLLRDGLATLLERRATVGSTCTAANAEAAVTAVGQFRPTLILLDIATEDGLSTAHRLTAVARGVQLLGFAARAHDHDLLVYAKAGITGFISREAGTQELFDAIDHAAKGELLCSPRIAATLFRHLAVFARSQPVRADAPQLTRREREIIQCIEQGLSNKEIARHLSVKLSTVKNHVHNILEKLHVNHRAEAAARARMVEADAGSVVHGSP